MFVEELFTGVKWSKYNFTPVVNNLEYTVKLVQFYEANISFSMHAPLIRALGLLFEASFLIYSVTKMIQKFVFSIWIKSQKTS